MKLIKQLETHRNHAVAKTVSYKNAFFPHGFASFLDALRRNKLIEGAERTYVDGKHRWANDVGTGGILVETAFHPFVNHDSTGDLTIVGSQDKLDLVQSLLNVYEVEYEGATKPEDIELKHQYHDALNPEIWDGKTMRPEVREKLMEAAKAFRDALKIEDLEIEDVVLTGSSANYNWTESSDIDVHLVVDFEKAIAKHGDLVEEYFNAKKNVFNNLHDISIHGNTVEMYVQDNNETHHSTGVYSLEDNKWLKEPEHDEPRVDDSAVRVKTAEMMNTIDSLVADCNKAAPVEALMERLKKMRQAGLDEAGEFSVENLVFKLLRHNGYLEKLAKCKTKAFDRELSIEDEEWNF
jgi:predicted nucleotidyltransferase